MLSFFWSQTAAQPPTRKTGGVINLKRIVKLQNFGVLQNVLASFRKSLEIVVSSSEILTLRGSKMSPLGSEKVGRCNVAGSYTSYPYLIDLVLFADDTNLFFSHSDLSYVMETINSEMIQLSNCFLANKLSINVKKSNFMIFKPRQNRQKIDLKIEIYSYRIEQVREVVFLGVIMDEHISWKPHISHIASKISKSIGIIFRSSFYLSRG